MLGEWVNESDDGIVKTHCKWSDNGNFLLREFDVKVEGRIALSSLAHSAIPEHPLVAQTTPAPSILICDPSRVTGTTP